MFSAYLSDTVAVSNHAHSGLTTESFREEGHRAIVEKYMREGDYCLFQFGHNDQKLANLKVQGGYRENLERYISECREKGVHPILVTPLARNSRKGGDGSYNDLLEEYAGVCKEIGGRLEVPVLDLHERSKEWITQNGREAVRLYFYPDDYTHTNDYGAYRMAGYVAEELAEIRPRRAMPLAGWHPTLCVGYSSISDCGARASHTSCGIFPSRSELSWQKYLPLADCVTSGFGDWTLPAHIALPQKPAGYEELAAPDVGAQLLADIKEPERSAAGGALRV
ncbi:MAG: GDSL-type esterase/lipase family protein [Lachnospiraceae bacterium]|nr:GDSL-type esterase/lipase family protein [Lachnospiraceae bacterium]